MPRLSRAIIGPIAIVLLISAAAVAGVIGVTHLAYPTVASYPDGDSEDAGKAVPVAGSDIPTVVLSSDAIEKIGLQTVAVTAGPATQMSVPYSAIFYDPAGETWVYVAVQDLVFQRKAVTVDVIDVKNVFLSEGPPVGTKVVAVGSAQLYGVEVGVEEE
jgi:hypothetical protein